MTETHGNRVDDSGQDERKDGNGNDREDVLRA